MPNIFSHRCLSIITISPCSGPGLLVDWLDRPATLPWFAGPQQPDLPPHMPCLQGRVLSAISWRARQEPSVRILTQGRDSQQGSLLLRASSCILASTVPPHLNNLNEQRWLHKWNMYFSMSQTHQCAGLEKMGGSPEGAFTLANPYDLSRIAHLNGHFLLYTRPVLTQSGHSAGHKLYQHFICGASRGRRELASTVRTNSTLSAKLEEATEWASGSGMKATELAREACEREPPLSSYASTICDLHEYSDLTVSADMGPDP